MNREYARQGQPLDHDPISVVGMDSVRLQLPNVFLNLPPAFTDCVRQERPSASAQAMNGSARPGTDLDVGGCAVGRDYLNVQVTQVGKRSHKVDADRFHTTAGRSRVLGKSSNQCDSHALSAAESACHRRGVPTQEA